MTKIDTQLDIDKALVLSSITVVAKDKVASEAAKALIERVGAYLPEDGAQLVEQAYAYADQCHEGQMRKSGEPYIAHPLETALFLAHLHPEASVKDVRRRLVGRSARILDELRSRGRPRPASGKLRE